MIGNLIELLKNRTIEESVAKDSSSKVRNKASRSVSQTSKKPKKKTIKYKSGLITENKK